MTTTTFRKKLTLEVDMPFFKWLAKRAVDEDRTMKSLALEAFEMLRDDRRKKPAPDVSSERPARRRRPKA